MQIICPNCGSKSPIEAGSLVTQTRIVCARCAVEFAAELSDEQKPAPAAGDERGIELFRADEVAPIFAVEAAPAFEAQPEAFTEFTEQSAAEAAPAEDAFVVETAHEAAPAAEVCDAAEAVTETADAVAETAAEPVAGEAAPAVLDTRAAVDVYEVLSLPEEAVAAAGAVSAAAVAELDHSNVLEDVFAAWNQSREAKFETGDVEAASAGTAEDYVTSPLASDYGTVLREDERPAAELAESSSAEFTQTEADAAAESFDHAADGVAPTTECEREFDAGGERESVHESFTDVPVGPRVAAARSFDGYGLGVRLMRVSPLWLLVSGLSFISFVVFCNWFFVPANLAQADATRPSSIRNEATNRSPASEASAADSSRPDSRNAGTHAETLGAEAEIVNASAKVEEPAPAPTATHAPAAEPAATPEAEQPKASEAAEEQQPQQPAPAGRFTVQVGSYNVQAEAEARAAGLRSAGQQVRVAEVEIQKRGKWYRVYVGGFASRADADAHGKSLRERGLAGSYVTTEAQ